VEVIVQPDAQMGNKEAYATSDPPRMFLRRSVFEQGERDEPRARMTFLHELVHIVLHPGAPKARMTGGNFTPKHIKPFNSAERQARVTAAAFLMPRPTVFRAKSPEDLQAWCRVSAQAAGIRFAQFKPRAEPAFVREGLNRLRLATTKAAERRIVEERERTVAWERARPIPGEDPARSRRSDDEGYGYRIERRQFKNRNSPFGWFLHNGKALAYFAKADPK
jgi:hypothetical protein